MRGNGASSHGCALIPSLCKLELVGDHRQLPAFVQQCWFNLEKTIATLKILPVTGRGSAQLSTIAVENSVDGLRESRPSTGSAEESYALITKSPSQKNII